MPSLEQLTVPSEHAGSSLHPADTGRASNNAESTRENRRNILARTLMLRLDWIEGLFAVPRTGAHTVGFVEPRPGPYES